MVLQAPTGSNSQSWQWTVVADPAQRAKLAELYRRSFNVYRDSGLSPEERYPGDQARCARPR